jgi:hypothetical protein
MRGQVKKVSLGKISVATTNHTGLPIEHWANRCLEKIIYVGKDNDSVIKDQAEAYKEQIRIILQYYIAQAIKSDRTTLYNLFIQQGHRDMAEILRKL